MFLNIRQAEAQIGYLKENIGRKILYCYGFLTENDFGKFRWCYRFATEEYLREAILQTQAFVLDYLLNHPLDCFNGPFVEGEPEYRYACAGKSKQEILLPILNEYYPAIMDRKDKIDGELKRRGLESESI